MALTVQKNMRTQSALHYPFEVGANLDLLPLANPDAVDWSAVALGERLRSPNAFRDELLDLLHVRFVCQAKVLLDVGLSEYQRIGESREALACDDVHVEAGVVVEGTGENDEGLVARPGLRKVVVVVHGIGRSALSKEVLLDELLLCSQRVIELLRILLKFIMITESPTEVLLMVNEFLRERAIEHT